MKDKIKNIPAGKTGTPNDPFLQYLNDEMSNGERHEFEKHLLDNDFENDAVEGLSEIDEKQKIQLIVDGLNRDLKRRTRLKKNRRVQMMVKPQWNFYFSVLILLFILVLLFFYIRMKQ